MAFSSFSIHYKLWYTGLGVSDKNIYHKAVVFGSQLFDYVVPSWPFPHRTRCRELLSNHLMIEDSCSRNALGGEIHRYAATLSQL